ncbi:ATP-binding cassette sub-family B member 8 mitochondrial [Fasciola gigantica]|uniref:Mitochondrial potassium channel ATP-binding subunit n=1 Tax=Fasciola gigantica TaxID=46835 RepID=A0A504YG77_FASGI|nr:ATP-binding cassette sub-family B member 8 mitochondrial [Fasciola gigantica]
MLRCHRCWFIKSFAFSGSPFPRPLPSFKQLILPANRYASRRGLFLSLSLGSVGGFAFSKMKLALPRVSCNSGPLDAVLPDPDDLVEEKLTKWNYSDIFALVKPDLLEFFGAILSAIAAAMLNVYIPLRLGDLVNKLSDCFNQKERITVLYGPALKLCFSYTLQACTTFLYIGLLASVGERMASRLRAQLFERLLHQDMAYFDVHSCSKLLDEIATDVQIFKSSFKQCVSHGLRSSAQIVGSIYALFTISTTLTYTLLGSLPCIFLVGTLMGAELRRQSVEARLQNSRALTVAEESLSHMRSVKSLNLEDTQYLRFCAELDRGRSLNEKLGYGVGCFQGLSNLALNGVVLVVLYVGGHLLSRNEINPGALMSFLATTQTVQRSLAQLSLLYAQVLRGSVAFSRIQDVLHSASLIDNTNQNMVDAPHKADWTRWSKSDFIPGISLVDIDFAYPSRKDAIVLDKLNLTIPSGSVVALVGKSGTGKSTVVSLIERFYDPAAGRILLGGQDLREIPLDVLRGQLIGYISQEPQIFNTTVRENIRFGRLNATDVEVEAAARLANAHDFIVNQLPAGYETRVGQGADSVAGLSGGQRQRIAIARVLLKNAPILLLDEATSALDAESEAQIQAALSRVMKDRTVLVIAHRLSTVRQADLIIVMDKGRTVEHGTHEDLMARQGAYYELVCRQENRDLLE